MTNIVWRTNQSPDTVRSFVMMEMGFDLFSFAMTEDIEPKVEDLISIRAGKYYLDVITNATCPCIVHKGRSEIVAAKEYKNLAAAACSVHDIVTLTAEFARLRQLFTAERTDAILENNALLGAAVQEHSGVTQ